MQNSHLAAPRGTSLTPKLSVPHDHPGPTR
jgi:hypothetical protein